MRRKDEQVERIRQMEEIFDRSAQALDELQYGLERYLENREDMKILKKYYSGLWLKDYEDDENGKIPDMKKGVLSQDGLYDLFAGEDELIGMMRQLVDEEDEEE